MRFYRCPRCREKQAYLGRYMDGTISVRCRSRSCIRAVVACAMGEPVERILRRGYAEWTRKLMSSVGAGGNASDLAEALAAVEEYKAALRSEYGPERNGFPPALGGVVDLLRVALDAE